LESNTENIEPIWTCVVNIPEELPYGPEGKETKKGTKHFSPGTKLYIIDVYGGMCETVTVIGLKRKPNRKLIKIDLKVNKVENPRLKLCYNPDVISLIKNHYNQSHKDLIDEYQANNIVNLLPLWQEELNK